MSCMNQNFRLFTYRINPFEIFDFSAHVSGTAALLVGGAVAVARGLGHSH